MDGFAFADSVAGGARLPGAWPHPGRRRGRPTAPDVARLQLRPVRRSPGYSFSLALRSTNLSGLASPASGQAGEPPGFTRPPAAPSPGRRPPPSRPAVAPTRNW